MPPATASIDVRTLDEILALQLTVAWAGEALSSPPRLGWWRTDLVDAEGGGDLFTRLLPRTAPWAALEATRAAATHGCLWRCHPDKAYQWEQRLRLEIGPHFTLDEPDAHRAARASDPAGACDIDPDFPSPDSDSHSSAFDSPASDPASKSRATRNVAGGTTDQPLLRE